MIIGGPFQKLELPDQHRLHPSAHFDYFDTARHPHGFLWHAGEFESIDVPGSVGTAALGINNRGEIVGFYCTTMPCGVPTCQQPWFCIKAGRVRFV